MIGHIFLGIIGLSGGIIIASALVALLLELKIIPRYAGITNTAKNILLYENIVMAGAVWGNIMTIYPVKMPGGSCLAALIGLCSGIFIGSWIIALTEILDMIPIMSRRTGLKRGLASVVIATALGKTVFTLVFYYKGW